MTFLTGLLMAIADSVPGVSGGTIAYIMNKYEEMFENINNILEGKFSKKTIVFLLKLAIGWIVGFISAVLVVTSLFEKYIYQVSSMFLGFILISIILVIKQEKDVIKGRYRNLIASVIGFLVVICLVFVQGQINIDIYAQGGGIFIYLYLFIVGIMAISAMLLPGISGSAVLMIFGVYFIVMEALEKIFILDFSQVFIVIALGLGILVGAVFAVKVINKLFKEKREMMIYLIIGLLIGSIFAIINGPMSITGVQSPLTLATFSPLWFIIGMGLLAILEIGIKKEGNHEKS